MRLCSPIRTALFDPLANPDDRNAYAFLRRAGREGPVLELPMSGADDQRELRYQYLTLWHGHRTVNGSSGYTPPLTQLLGSAEQSPFTGVDHLDAAIAFVKAVGVRYLVVHGGAFENPAVEAALVRVLRSDRRQAVAEHAFGRTSIFTLAATASRDELAGWRPIPVSSVHARASHASDRVPLLFDKDRDTRWLTAGRQTGSEWVELELDAPRNVGAVRMQTAERSFGDYPRELAVDVIEAGPARTLFRGSVLPAFGRGFAADHFYPNIDIVLPDNQAQVIRLRQLGVTDKLFWSIHELELWERGRQ